MKVTLVVVVDEADRVVAKRRLANELGQIVGFLMYRVIENRRHRRHRIVRSLDTGS